MVRGYSFGVAAVGAALLVVAGCGEYVPKPTAAPTRPLQPPVASSVIASPKPLGPNLDQFGNLRDSDERVLGFEMPMGSEPSGKGGNRYVAAHDKRFVRFFRSRGYRVEALMEGAKKITHTDRTLQYLTVAEADQVRSARVFVSPGPGPGYTMRFHVGPRRRAETGVLDELRRAERQLDPAFEAAQAKYRAQREAEAARRAGALARSSSGATGRTAPKAGDSAQVGDKRKRRVYTRDDVAALRRKAAKQLEKPSVRAMSKKIRDWERKTGRTFYH